MDDKGPDLGKAPPSLAAALRTARLEVAERSQSLADLRSAEIGRLELLREALEPVLAQLPEGVDLFDTGIVPGEHPRLFVDMIAFVDMARDRRTYRFHLDTRHGRKLLAETDGLHAMTGSVTDYIARRLVEREKALASLTPDGPVLLAPAPEPPAPVSPGLGPPASGSPLRMVRGIRLGLHGLGVVALAGLVWLGMHYMANRLPVW